MQGAYRVQFDSTDLMETFVAAAGPAGWRYFGRAQAVVDGPEIYRVDHVVDLRWRLVRYRWSGPAGEEMVAIPRGGDIEVWTMGPDGERTEVVAGASAVWGASPCSLLVLDRLLAGSGAHGIFAAALGPPFDPRPIAVRLEPVGTREVPTTGGVSTVREIDVTAADRTTRALLRSDLPLRAEGWFELVS